MAHSALDPEGGHHAAGGRRGVGKTSLWCYLLARISGGRDTMLSEALEEGDAQTDPLADPTCMYFSAEDSTSARLKRQLENYGANTGEIITVGMEHLGGFSYRSPALEKMIAQYEPAVCVFDPVQAFFPKGSSMSSRQQSREALNELVRLGNQYGTAFLLVCHTNKKMTDDWRMRISGSADLPDIARSVIFTDYTEITEGNEIRFISNEKNSYHAPQETVLYTLKSGTLAYAGMSRRKFADFVRGEPARSGAPERQSKKEQCTAAMIALLEERGETTVKELNAALGEQGFSAKTIEHAKTALIEAGRLLRRHEPNRQGNEWYVSLVPAGEAEEGETMKKVQKMEL